MPRTVKHQPPRRKKKSKLKGILPYAVVFILGIVGFTAVTSNINSQDFTGVELSLATAEGDAWWDANFAYRQKINVTNSNQQSVQINHQQMVKAKTSLNNATDLRVVAQLAGQTQELATFVVSPNTANTIVRFDSPKAANTNLYLYYGNNIATKSLVLGTKSLTGPDNFATLSEAQSPKLKIMAKNTWHVIENNSVKVNMGLTTQGNKDWQWYYSLNNGTKVKLQNPNSTDTSINLQDISTGNQSIAVLVKTPEGWLRSNNINIIVANPVYVAWTIDWEGYDIKDWVLAAAQDISTRYSIPMTHFFNPRIYVAAEISDYRKQTLTNWVLARANVYKDEIAMHMHMHYDMVRAAGLEPIRKPSWGSGRDGYDVLTSSYNYDQFKQLISWGVREFQKNGLPTPTGYRAGGWFANLDTLKALNDYGFSYDSSGRDKYTFGTQKQAGAWDLTQVTQPYQPSQNNINTNASPNMNLWEIPNNGNDSYWFSKEDLIARFYANFDPSKPATSAKIITYLSHFDWFDIDQPKIEALFEEISKYSLANDSGPVVFVTLQQALNQFK